MTDHTTPLSPRHERFVLEFLRDGNATRAYIRAGYSPRGAQPSASRLLRQPHIEAAIAAGQRRVAAALELSVERLGREYARIAFANIDDFVSVEDDGRLRVDLEKASQAQRAGIVELKVSNHSKPEQMVTLKLGKLQALAALTDHVGLFTKRPEPVRLEPGLTAKDRDVYEDAIETLGEDWEQAVNRLEQAERERDTARAALAAAEARLAAAGLATPPPKPPDPPRAAEPQPAVPREEGTNFFASPRACGEKVPSASEADEGLPRATPDAIADEAPRSPSSALRAPSPRHCGEKQDAGDPCAIAAPEEPQPPIVLKGLGPPDPPRPTRTPPSPAQPTAPPDVGPAQGRIFWNTARQPPSGPTWHDIMRQPSGFPRR